MSSAVPIHPITRLVRRAGLASTNTAKAYLPSSSSRLFFSTTRSVSARPSRKAGAQAKSEAGLNAGASRDAASTSSAASPPTRETPQRSPADGLNSGSARGQLPPNVTRPSAVKMTDKRSNQPPKDAETPSEKLSDEKLAEIRGRNNGRVDGVVQKIFKGASLHPAAVEQDRQATQAATAPQEGPISSRPNVTIIESESSKGSDDSKLAEGVVISASAAGAAESSKISSSTQSFSSQSSTPPSQDSPRQASSSSPISGSDNGRGNFIPNSSETMSGNVDSGDGGSGPPAPTQAPELGHIRPPNPLHPFNTHTFIKRLQEAGLVAKRVDDVVGDSGSASEDPSAGTSLSSSKRHDPAEAIMEATRHLLVSRGERVLDHQISKTEVENQSYLFTAALSELRTELQVRARNDAAALRSMVTLLQREVDGLNQKMREDVGGMKHDIQVDMNNRKGEAKEEQNTLEQEIQDLNNRFTISISDLKTEIEQNIKWDATRRALTVVFGCVVILIATLTAADYLTREEVEDESHPVRRAGEASKAAAANEALMRSTPKSAEELGLVANYDEGDGSRFV